MRENGKKRFLVLVVSLRVNAVCGVCGSFSNGRGREIRGGKYGFKASTVFA